MTFHGLLARITVVGCALSSAADAQRASTPAVLSAMPGSSLTIRGSTTVGARWHCSARNVESNIAVADRGSTDSPELPDVRGVTVHVPVSALRCQSGPMERSMRRALKADRDTAAVTISGRFEIADDMPPAGARERDLVGPLKVAGIERNVFLRAHIESGADGSLRVVSALPLTLTSFGITPPRVLFGAVRARDAVTVEVELHYPGWRLAEVTAFR